MKKIMMVLVLVLLVGGGIYYYKMGTGMSPKTDLMMEDKKVFYTIDEVAKHNSETDCWMAIEGKVYNATSFVISHPGGPAILKGCGTDATKLFKERPTNKKGPHPESAREQLVKLYIGELSK